MVHDTTQADLWYHDAIVPTVKLGNDLHLLIRKKYSADEIEVLYTKMLDEVEKNRKILYEVYLEKRRLENAERGNIVSAVRGTDS